MLNYTEQIPSPEEYNHLRKALNLDLIDSKATQIALTQSLKCISVYDEHQQLVGLGRVVGDGALVYVISNVFVLPQYQKQGVGSQIMHLLMSYLDSVCCEHAMVMLMARKGTEGFYSRFGFISRPNEALGAGMCKYY